MIPKQLQALRVGDRVVEFHDLGSGLAVVLFHGGQCTADDWEPVVETLSRKYRLILPDGFVHPLDPWAMWQLLDHLAISRAVLVGHSAGGVMTRGMYRLAPLRVAGIVDIDSSGVGKLTLARKMPNDLFSPKARAMYEQRRTEMENLLPHHRGDYPSSATIDRRMTAYKRAKMPTEERAASRPQPRMVGQVAATAPPAPIDDTGPFIKCPALVVQTGRGKIGREFVTDEYLRENMQAGDLQFEMIKEAGHWPWIEDPATFLAIVEPFLARTAR